MVSHLMDVNLPQGLYFHNLQHTIEVVEATDALCKEEGVSKKEQEILMVAAWLHDIGHLKVYRGHEEVSVEYAKNFLQKMGWDASDIELVVDCVRATKMPQRPDNHIEKIICDADLYHLAAENYLAYLGALRTEWELVLGRKKTDRQWLLINIEFLSNHSYFTDFGKRVLEPNKAKNIELLIGQL